MDNKDFIKTLKSGIKDNRNRGSVSEFLTEKILPGSKLLAVSAYFTIYAYESLKDHLNQIEHLNFLFGKPRFIKAINEAVQLVNFWPTDDLNKYINLKNRVEARMALVDIAATTEDNILNTEALEELIKDDLKYRDKQLL